MSSSRTNALPPSTPHELAKRKRGSPDFIGHTIENIYQTHGDDWIIYKTDAVHCEVADELKNEDPQQYDAYLNRLGEIQDLRSQVKQLLTEVKNPEKYDGSIADAMAMALRNNVVPARKHLEDVLANIKNDIYTVARFRYLELTLIGMVFLLPVLIIAAWMTRPLNSEAFNLILAGTAGLVGAIFSIATQIRSRAVGTESNFRALLTDCIVRLVIGIVSGCFLQLLIETGALKIVVGSFDISKDSAAGWRSVVAVGFIAGFVERLVPSLLQEGLPLPRGPKSREEANDTVKAATRRRASRKRAGDATSVP